MGSKRMTGTGKKVAIQLPMEGIKFRIKVSSPKTVGRGAPKRPSMRPTRMPVHQAGCECESQHRHHHHTTHTTRLPVASEMRVLTRM